ncbi:MAG: hypothetical protein E7650_06240 [Ruminococcaceae bacterium]|nr:hypothetical protein [Oscillospiraceae bacterium]
MKTKKLLTRFLCALLVVLTLACMLPAISVSAAEPPAPLTPVDQYTVGGYESEADLLAQMTKYYDNGEYALYCFEELGLVAYQKKSTGELLFTNPWDMSKEPSSETSVRYPMMSQIILSYEDSQKNGKTLTSYADAMLKGQYAVTPIQNGVRVEYAMGEISARILLPLRIEKSSFEERIQKPLKENLSVRNYAKFMSYYSLKEQGGPGIAAAYPVTEEKGIDIYVYNDDITKTKVLRQLEAWVLKYCPDYSFAQMDEDYELVDFYQEATSPPVFRVALEYTIDANGLSVSLPANGLRYDESAYRVTDLQMLPYMGASYKGNPNRIVKVKGEGGQPDTEYQFDDGAVYSGYAFLPDGSGALYELTQGVIRTARVYGEDYALMNVTGSHTMPMRMPVFGQVETVTDKNGVKTDRGYFAIIEEGDTLASLQINQSTQYYSTIIPSFITRQSDTSKSGWTVYATRRYTNDYKMRYILLSDEGKAQAASLTNYYECSWMGMARAYRDYLAAQNNGFERLTSEDVAASIPLYLETFGCMDTVKKIMSVPVTVSVALTSFDDIETMYEYLLGEGVSNVQFKMTGYANGGLYSEVPYKLKWERSVGGKSGFKDLLEYAADHPELGLFPDFDFVYTKNGDSSVNMKKYGARTVSNRYTTKRMYSVTKQTLVSHFQMVLSPATFSHFYEKLEKKYSKLDNKAISLSTLGSDLNSSFNEDDLSLREDSKFYTITALDYFSSKDYDVMVGGGNAYTWGYADYILDVPLTSNRYNNEYATVPFMGVVLHGYVQFAGTALNMEGNLTYAMLKAMESGAGAYFLLSYTNTELLKEDELLSQNYSVRYDIWQKRLVEIYKELNSVLADVQTKLIIDHQFLDGKRVPDADELLQDAIAEAEKQAAAVKDRYDNINLAMTSLSQIKTRLGLYQTMLTNNLTAIHAQRSATSTLMTAWEAYRPNATGGTAEHQAFVMALSTTVAKPMAELAAMRMTIDELMASAEANLQFLVDTQAEAAVIASASAMMVDIETAYDALVDGYGQKTAVTYDPATDRDNFLYDATQYTDVSVQNLQELFKQAMLKDGILPVRANLDKMVTDLAAGLEIKSEPVAGENGMIVDGETDTSYKYAVDSEIVYVTYGDFENGAPVAYKSLILNFNDYAVTTEVDGVIYNIAAYDYVVIGPNS